jgi:HK97 family phage major capsid protein
MPTATREETLFQQKTKALRDKQGEIKKFWDDRDVKIAQSKQADPNFNDTEVSAEDKKTLDRIFGELKDLNAEVESFNEYKTVAGRAEAMATVLGQPVGRPEYANTDPRSGYKERKSPGREFVEDPAIKAWMENELGLKGPGAQVPRGLKINSPDVEAKGVIMSGSNSGGALVRRDYDDTVSFPLRPLTIVDLITVVRTGSNLVEYVRVNSMTRAAAVVPEVTDTSGSGYTAGAKPQASMAFEIVQAGVKTIAVWMPITRQILSDAPQLESEIDAFEQTDLQLALEDEIITGTGGTHFTGLENTIGITPHVRLAGDADLLVTTRKARTTSMVVARARSTGFLFNPYDWETIDLLRNATAGNFYFGGPTVMGLQQLWGLPVAESEVIPQGTGYTGDLKQMKLWDREQPTRRITDSHSDFFTHNLIAILTELRAAFGIKRPAAIVKIDLVVGANS